MLVLITSEIYAGVRGGMLGRGVLWLLAVADDVDGRRRRGLMTHVKNPVKGATLLLTKPQATGRELVDPQTGHSWLTWGYSCRGVTNRQRTRRPEVPAGYNIAMLFMVIEKYSHGPGPVYERAAERGRMLPEGLRYVDSWIVDDGRLDRCFQIMETDNPELFDIWRARWADLGDFEVFPVIKSGEAARRVGIQWDT